MLTLFFGWLSAVHVAAADVRTNVLFLVVDDLAPAFEAYNYPAIAPNLEKLASRSVQFQRAYVSVAVCAPSRTAFLTGLRPDTTQVWTIGPYFRNTSRGEGMQVIPLPQFFRSKGYNTTGSGKIFHPGTPSGGIITSEGGGDMCPGQRTDNMAVCKKAPAASEPGSWTEPYFFCDQYANDTVQSPMMQDFPCASDAWPSCGSGCVQSDSCIQCLEACGTWGKAGVWDECDCPGECYPEGVIATNAIKVLGEKVLAPEVPFFHAVGFKRPHLSYRAPSEFFAMYNLDDIALPVHPLPSPTAPAISYSHSCIVSRNDSSSGPPDKPCDFMKYTRNYSYGTSGGVEHGLIEINKDATAVRQLRKAYYATITFMDSQLGRVLDFFESSSLVDNTIITFIGDHGYQNGEKGEWTKINNFELATRIPMYVSVPEAIGGGGWGRGVKQSAIVESVDLYPTIVDLVGFALPAMALGGESLRPLLKAAAADKYIVVKQPGVAKGDADADVDAASAGAGAEAEANTNTTYLEAFGEAVSYEEAASGVRGEISAPFGDRGGRVKDWALSQWPRRPSCMTHHSCLDGHGDPYTFTPDQAVMGYTLRVNAWRYTAWFQFDWDSTTPVWDAIVARELYSHIGDKGDSHSGETFEWENVVQDTSMKPLVDELHANLTAIVKLGLVKPML